MKELPIFHCVDLVTLKYNINVNHTDKRWTFNIQTSSVKLKLTFGTVKMFENNKRREAMNRHYSYGFRIAYISKLECNEADQLSRVISGVHCAACHLRTRVAGDFNGRFVECSRLHAVCRTGNTCPITG